MVPRSLRALLSQSIDYAGLFPPARLPMSEAVERYAEYRNRAEGWMLSRFVCPASRLGEFSEAAWTHFERGPDWELSVLAGGGNALDDFRQTLPRDLLAIHTFLARHPGQVAADVLEIRLPAEILSRGAEHCGHFVSLLRAGIEGIFSGTMAAFLEVPLVGKAAEDLSAVVSAVAEVNQRPGTRLLFGLKIRAGGLDASAFPSSESVARFIAACRNAGIAWKATAGLHRPFRYFDDELGVYRHGFVNMFAAAVLTVSHSLSSDEIRAILDDGSPGNFVFNEDSLRWRDHSVTADQIEQARPRTMVSFGSCSFDEPCEELRKIGFG